jgi:hypothetical protein
LRRWRCEHGPLDAVRMFPLRAVELLACYAGQSATLVRSWFP